MSRQQHPVYGDPRRFQVVVDFVAERFAGRARYVVDFKGPKNVALISEAPRDPSRLA